MTPLCHLEHCFFYLRDWVVELCVGEDRLLWFYVFGKSQACFMQEWIETNGTWWHLFFDVGLAFLLVKLSIAFIAGSHTVFGFIRDKGSLCRLSIFLFSYTQQSWRISFPICAVLALKRALHHWRMWCKPRMWKNSWSWYVYTLVSMHGLDSFQNIIIRQLLLLVILKRIKNWRAVHFIA